MEDIDMIDYIQLGEVRRSLMDRFLGRNKDFDKIVKIRKQIIKINTLFRDAKLFTKINANVSTKDIHIKYFNLVNDFINESQVCKEFGSETLLKILTIKRNKLIDLLKDSLDLSDIQKEIREDKLKSIGL